MRTMSHFLLLIAFHLEAYLLMLVCVEGLCTGLMRALLGQQFLTSLKETDKVLPLKVRSTLLYFIL